MAVSTLKFSAFTNGGDLANDETTVGLFSGSNAQFNNPWTFLAPGTTGDRPTPVSSIYYRLRFNTSLQLYEYYDPEQVSWVQITTSGQFNWNTITASQTAVSNNGYFMNGVSLITLTLPLLSSVGDTIAVAGLGVGGWRIAQNPGQSITVSPDITTVGSGGSLASTEQYDSIYLVCSVANTQWTSVGGPQGSITIV